MTDRWHKGSFWGAGNVLCLGPGAHYMSVFNLRNSNTLCVCNFNNESLKVDFCADLGAAASLYFGGYSPSWQVPDS